MRMRIVCAAALALLATGAAAGGETTLTLSAGADYSTGDYGSSDRTEIWYFPVIAKYERGDLTAKITIPYLTITGPGNVIGGDGVIVVPLPPGAALPRRTASGVGDVVAAASYTVLDDRGSGTLLDLTGKVKVPTADESKGLGTGEFDYAVQLDAYRRFGAATGFATAGYKVLGDPPGVSFRNVWLGAIGTSYRASSATSLGVMFDFRRAALSGGPPLRELTAFLSRRLGGEWKIQLYAVKGLADGSPDWGGGSLLSRMF